MERPEWSTALHAVVNVADCYLRGAGVQFPNMHDFFPDIKELEDIGLTNKPFVKEAKHIS
jgi:hypothetical protein